MKLREVKDQVQGVEPGFTPGLQPKGHVLVPGQCFSTAFSLSLLFSPRRKF